MCVFAIFFCRSHSSQISIVIYLCDLVWHCKCVKLFDFNLLDLIRHFSFFLIIFLSFFRSPLLLFGCSYNLPTPILALFFSSRPHSSPFDPLFSSRLRFPCFCLSFPSSPLSSLTLNSLYLLFSFDAPPSSPCAQALCSSRVPRSQLSLSSTFLSQFRSFLSFAFSVSLSFSSFP